MSKFDDQYIDLCRRILNSGEKITNLQGEEVLIGQTGKSGCYMGKMTIELE